MDMEFFNTDAVKIPPAHILNGYKVGQRHKLKSLSVAAVKALQEMELYVKPKDNPMQIPICRCIKGWKYMHMQGKLTGRWRGWGWFTKAHWRAQQVEGGLYYILVIGSFG